MTVVHTEITSANQVDAANAGFWPATQDWIFSTRNKKKLESGMSTQSLLYSTQIEDTPIQAEPMAANMQKNKNDRRFPLPTQLLTYGQ